MYVDFHYYVIQESPDAQLNQGSSKLEEQFSGEHVHQPVFGLWIHLAESLAIWERSVNCRHVQPEKSGLEQDNLNLQPPLVLKKRQQAARFYRILLPKYLLKEERQELLQSPQGPYQAGLTPIYTF